MCESHEETGETHDKTSETDEETCESHDKTRDADEETSDTDVSSSVRVCSFDVVPGTSVDSNARLSAHLRASLRACETSSVVVQSLASPRAKIDAT